MLLTRRGGPSASPARRLYGRTRLLLPASCTIFVIHALHYAYFFVDDEGIAFVFARNLLRGRGLVYNSFEGRVEGYSNFLQVLVSTVWLQLAAITGLGRLAPFFMGKAVSLAAGVGAVMLAGTVLGRRPDIRRPGLAAGLAFLVLFPPLAVWSCSSLEMASVTLLVTIMTIALLEGGPAWDRALAAASCLLVLLRIDGFVFVTALIAPAWLAAGPERRRTLARLAVPILTTLTVYHAWRVWYFGDWLPCPLVAKVLYKLHPVHDTSCASLRTAMRWPS